MTWHQWTARMAQQPLEAVRVVSPARALAMWLFVCVMGRVKHRATLVATSASQQLGAHCGAQLGNINSSRSHNHNQPLFADLLAVG